MITNAYSAGEGNISETVLSYNNDRVYMQHRWNGNGHMNTKAYISCIGI